MHNANYFYPKPENEPMRDFRPGTDETKKLKEALDQVARDKTEIFPIINGKEVKTGDIAEWTMPHEHRTVISRYHKVNKEHVGLAIDAALKAHKEWENMHWKDRAAVLLRCADLCSNKYRYLLDAAVMLSLSKNPWEAEIDAIGESVDNMRYACHFMSQIYSNQPYNSYEAMNHIEYRPLEGFMYVITPFNFLAIGSFGNACTIATGNTTLWKMSADVLLPAYYLMKIFKEAGLPDGVINFLPGSGRVISDVALKHKDFAGCAFVGSNPTFNGIWKEVAENLENYRNFPKLSGETGGKAFCFMHPSADVLAAAVAIVRAGYAYQGQKCGACTRVYCPESLWPQLKQYLGDMIGEMKVGDPRDFSNYQNAVIDKEAYDRIMGYIQDAKNSSSCEILAGGTGDDSVGYFIQPTLIKTTDPHHKIMEEEIFGPIVAVYVYKDDEFEETVALCDATSPYGLCGCVFANDRKAVQYLNEKLRYSAGNYYVNDKCIGAVAGHQPFGGARASGTNDKSGGNIYLLRFTSPRLVKENITPPHEWKFAHML